MMLSGQTIERLKLVEPMFQRREAFGMSFGLGPAGYDIRIDLSDLLSKERWLFPNSGWICGTIEKVRVPTDVVGQIHVKSSWTRRQVSTVGMPAIDPGFCGHLTLSLFNHGSKTIILQHGMPIAQLMFQYTDLNTEGYTGKYQNQGPGATEYKDG